MWEVQREGSSRDVERGSRGRGGGKTRNEWKSSGKCYLKKERGVTRTDRGFRDRGKGIR